MKKLSKREVAGKYRQRPGWVVYYFSGNGDEVVSNEMDYHAACALVRELRNSWNVQEQRYEDD